MTKQSREKLEQARSHALLLKRLEQQLTDRRSARLPSLSLDGMPRGKGPGHGLEVQMEQIDSLERILAHEKAEFRRMERAARKCMEGMPADQYAFCSLYYLAGLTLEETADAIGYSRRQCFRIRKALEEDAA